jgi:hypothetical protein
MSILTIQDIYDSHEKYRKNNTLFLTYDPKKVSTSADYGTNFITHGFLKADGKVVFYPKVKIEQQLLSSNAKLPIVGKNEKAKTMRINISHMDMDDIRGDDYTARSMRGRDEQNKEDKRVETNCKMFYDSNLRTIAALQMYYDEYEFLCKKIISDKNDNDDLPIDVNQDQSVFKTNDDVPIRKPIVDKYKEKNGKKKVVLKDLEHPLYRINLPYQPKSETLKRWNFKYDENKKGGKKERIYEPYVFDIRSSKTNQQLYKKNNRHKLFVARLERDGKNKILTTDNAHKKITRKSIVTMIVNMGAIVISGKGFSIRPEVTEMHGLFHSFIEKKSLISSSSALSLMDQMGLNDDVPSGDTLVDLLNSVDLDLDDDDDDTLSVKKTDNLKIKNKTQTVIDSDIDDDTKSADLTGNTYDSD